jgi:hypothetical protein
MKNVHCDDLCKSKGSVVWLVLMMVGLAIGLCLFRPEDAQNASSFSPASEAPVQRALHIFDKSSRGEKLFSKNSREDLWLRDAAGRERCIASNVVRANFSPDGNKFAYATSGYDLFIETIEGRQIAQLARVQDHTWSSNSMAITCSAIAALDYPELEQMVVYELESNQQSLLPKAK